MPTEPTPDQLVQEHIKLDDWIKSQQKAFDEHMKPYRERCEVIGNLLLKQLNDAGCDSFKTEHGTAYRSTIITPKAVDKEKYLDWCLDNYEKYGAMLQIGAPKKEVVKEYQDDNNGQLPPWVEQSSFTRVNIRRS